jgi:hypothetical protein
LNSLFSIKGHISLPPNMFLSIVFIMLTLNRECGLLPIQSFPGEGGVRSTVTPSLQAFTSSNDSVHFSYSISVALA